MPTDGDLQGAVKTGRYADGYGYDVRALPAKNVMVTSSFTGWTNYMMDFGKMLHDAEAMKRFGNTVVVWDLHQRKPKEDLRRARRAAGDPLRLGQQLLLHHHRADLEDLADLRGQGQGLAAKAVGTIGDPSKVPLPVDISISADDRYLWVNTFMDGKTRLFDISDPFNPKQVNTFKIGAQVNMVSQSWDGKRVYFTIVKA